MLEKSILILAHPDDEVLWFSSIVDKVDEVLLCFLDYAPRPHLGMGRRKSLSRHPLKNVSCLGIAESEAFGLADWQDPRITKFGVEIPDKAVADRYVENYYTLKERLGERLKGYANVFTHNPWGEYGNEDHIQVYRVLKDIHAQGHAGFDLWFSNYCSNRSFNLMLKYIPGFFSRYVTLETNPILGERVKQLYKENDCWTWYDDWVWFKEESLMKDEFSDEGEKCYGHIFPLNLVKIEGSLQ